MGTYKLGLYQWSTMALNRCFQHCQIGGQRRAFLAATWTLAAAHFNSTGCDSRSGAAFRSVARGYPQTYTQFSGITLVKSCYCHVVKSSPLLPLQKLVIRSVCWMSSSGRHEVLFNTLDVIMQRRLCTCRVAGAPIRRAAA